MQRQAPSIRHRGGTSGTFPLHCRLTDGSATDMKTSEGLSLPAYPCSRLGLQWLIKINGCVEWKREKLDRRGTEVHLDVLGSYSKICSQTCLCTVLEGCSYIKYPQQPVDASELRLQRHCDRIKPEDWCDCWYCCACRAAWKQHNGK